MAGTGWATVASDADGDRPTARGALGVLVVSISVDPYGPNAVVDVAVRRADGVETTLASADVTAGDDVIEIDGLQLMTEIVR